eukprot:scaffold14899_cov18-Tisochrysis_lutea.AAC.1
MSDTRYDVCRPDALSKHQKLCTADSPMKGGGGGTSAGAGGGSSSGSGGAGAPERMMGSSSNSTGNGGPAEHAEGGEPLEECEHCNRRMRCACSRMYFAIHGGMMLSDVLCSPWWEWCLAIHVRWACLEQIDLLKRSIAVIGHGRACLCRGTCYEVKHGIARPKI